MDALLLALAKSLYYWKCVNIATYPIIIFITYYYRSYFLSYSVALPRHKIKFKLNRPDSMLVFFKGKSFSAVRDRPLALDSRNCEKSFSNHTSLLAKVLFGPVHTNPGRLKPRHTKNIRCQSSIRIRK